MRRPWQQRRMTHKQSKRRGPRERERERRKCPRIASHLLVNTTIERLQYTHKARVSLARQTQSSQVSKLVVIHAAHQSRLDGECQPKRKNTTQACPPPFHHPENVRRLTHLQNRHFHVLLYSVQRQERKRKRNPILY